MKKSKQVIMHEEIFEISVSDIELHDLANEHPRMTDSEFERLKESISEIGQQEEVLVYRNKIVDGRHRYWAIESLELSTIKAKIIPYNTPINTVKELVFGSEVRRHQTPVQKAIKAWRATQRDGLSYRDAAMKFMTSRTMISKCKYISKHRGEKLLDDLYNQIPVTIGTRSTTNIDALQKLIAKEEETNMHARLKEEYQSPKHIAEYSKLYLGPLAQEPTDIVEYVSRGAYAILQQKK